MATRFVSTEYELLKNTYGQESLRLRSERISSLLALEPSDGSDVTPEIMEQSRLMAQAYARKENALRQKYGLPIRWLNVPPEVEDGEPAV